MKKKLLILVICLLSIFCLTGCGNDNPEPQKGSAVEKVFEEIGYCKMENKNRSFMIYTDETNKNKLIEYARTEPHTDFKFTYVTFLSSKDKEKVRSNTMFFKDPSRGLLLTGLISDPSVVLGTYKIAPNNNEFWYEGAGLITGGEYQQLNK